MRKIEKQIKTTMNRSVYNKAYKEKNASCSFCKWHCGCNGDYKFYSEDGRIPNWKLVSKNRKQWMKKP